MDDFIEPEILIVPLVAFDRAGGRLGYGGGFYDRTLELLRSRRPTRAIGFAYAAQEAEALPLEPTDQPLDMVVTEAEVIASVAEGCRRDPGRAPGRAVEFEYFWQDERQGVSCG